MGSFTATIAEAKKAVQKRKRHFPHLFPEYIELLRAEADVKEARERLARCKERWKNLAK